jgi:hypothetical protein
MTNQHLHIIPPGVQDLRSVRTFHTEVVGWKPSSSSNDGIIFYQAGGVVRSLVPPAALAEAASLPAEGTGFRGMALATATRSERKADEIISDMKLEGVTLLEPP